MIQNELISHKDDISGSPRLDTLRWHRIKTTLGCKRVVPSITAHSLSVFEAIIKGVNRSLTWTEQTVHPKVLFHASDRRLNFRFREGQTIPLEIILTQASTREAYRWLEAFNTYLADLETGKNFGIVNLEEPEIRSLGNLVDETAFTKVSGEICMEFLTPLAFRTTTGFGRTSIDEADFVSTLAGRISKLFGVLANNTEMCSDIRVVCDYWRYTEVMHSSSSQPGTT